MVDCQSNGRRQPRPHHPHRAWLRRLGAAWQYRRRRGFVLAYRIFSETGITADEDGCVQGILSIFKQGRFRKMDQKTFRLALIARYSGIFRPVGEVRK